MHCTVLLCVQYNIKLWCLFLSWFFFFKEATVANDEKRKCNKCCEPGNYVTFSLEQVRLTAYHTNGLQHKLFFWNQVINNRIVYSNTFRYDPPAPSGPIRRFVPFTLPVSCQYDR